MKTLVLIAVLAAFCAVNICADPEPEADPDFVRRYHQPSYVKPYYGNHGHYYGNVYGRGKRSADPEPEAAALADAEPDAEASRSYKHFNSHYGVIYPSYHTSARQFPRRRWRRSSEFLADAHRFASYRSPPFYGGYTRPYGYSDNSYHW